MSLPLDVTERLLDRVRNAAAEEGMTLESYCERALINAVIDSERRLAKNSDIFRNAKLYPYKCDYCEKRFKLPMHRARHITWSHPDMAAEVDNDRLKLPEVEPEPEPETETEDEERQNRTVARPKPVEPEKQEFKLAPGIDADMLDDFDKYFADDVPRLD